MTRTYPLSAPKLNPFHSTPRNSIVSFNLGVIKLLIRFQPKHDVDDLLQFGKQGDEAFLREKALGSLEVRIVSAQGLALRESGQPPKPYCKVFLFGLQVGRQGFGLKEKTLTEHDTISPRWNHTVMFHNITLEKLKDCCLEVSVWDENTRTRKEFVGGVRLSCIGAELSTSLNPSSNGNAIDSQATEREVWTQVLENKTRKYVECFIVLRYFTPFDKIRSTFGSSRSGSFLKMSE